MHRRGFLRALGIGAAVVAAAPIAAILPAAPAAAAATTPSKTLLRKLSLSDPALNKIAVDSINEFTRKKMTEDGLFRQLLPHVYLCSTEHYQEPVEPALSIPFSELPDSVWIRGERYTAINGCRNTNTIRKPK